MAWMAQYPVHSGSREGYRVALFEGIRGIQRVDVDSPKPGTVVITLVMTRWLWLALGIGHLVVMRRATAITERQRPFTTRLKVRVR